MTEQELDRRTRELNDREKSLNDREKGLNDREAAETAALDSKTRMVKPLPSNTKMVKLRAFRAFGYTEKSGKRAIAVPGTEVEVPQTEAEEILGRKYDGQFGFSGERYVADGDAALREIRMAEAVQ